MCCGTKNFFLLICLLSSIFLTAQEDFIKGRLSDAQTGEPIPFATVRLMGKAVGVISNQDGGFRIPVEFKEESDAIEISSMGYTTKMVKFASLSTAMINDIRLDAYVFELEGSVVRAKLKKLAARDIVRYAINNIKNNYPQSKFGYVGYYRDYQLKDSHYVNLNEAIIEVIDQGFNSSDAKTSRFLMHDYRRNLDFEIDSFAAKPYDYREFDKIVPSATIRSYGGNEFVLLRVHNAIRNHSVDSYSFIHELAKDFIKNHIFQKGRKTYYDNRAVYQISIFREDLNFGVRGTIYIDESNFAIRKLNYSVFKLRRNAKKFVGNESRGARRLEIPNKASDNDLLFEVVVEYSSTKSEDKMYLNYISFHNQFMIKRPPKFQIEEVTLDIASKHIEIKLNRPLANLDDLKLRDFKIYYLNKRVGIESAKFHKSNNTLVLQVLPSESKKKIIEKLFSTGFDKKKEEFSLQLNKLKDAEGNLLEMRKEEYLDQFREFFVQEIVAEREEVVADDHYLKLNRPLHDSTQYIYRESRSKDYWMNTPLKTIE